MKTKTIRIAAFVMFMMTVASVSAQARTEREFLLLQQLKERKLEEAKIRETEVSKPQKVQRVEQDIPKSAPCPGQ